jgi:hypothetical protein
MQAAYLNALFLSPPVILGRQLLPYSLAHIAFLRSIESPFYTGKPAAINDLVVAAFVCSHAWPFPFLSQDPEALGRACAEWGESLGPVDFQSNLAAFWRYIREYSAMPLRGTPPDADEIIQEYVPWMFTIAFFLMNDLRCSEVEAWNKPVGRAFTYATVKAVLRGDNTLVSEEEISIKEMLASGITMDQIAKKLEGEDFGSELSEVGRAVPSAPSGLSQHPARPSKQKRQREQKQKDAHRDAQPCGQIKTKGIRRQQTHKQKTQRRRTNPGNPKFKHRVHGTNIDRRPVRRKNK